MDLSGQGTDKQPLSTGGGGAERAATGRYSIAELGMRLGDCIWERGRRGSSIQLASFLPSLVCSAAVFPRSAPGVGGWDDRRS